MEAQYGTILQADMHSFKAFTVVLEQMFLWQPLLGEFTLQRELGELCLILDCSLVAVGSSGILKGKQKLGGTFNSDKLGGIDFTKFPKLSMCSAGAGWYWLVLVKVYV